MEKYIIKFLTVALAVSLVTKETLTNKQVLYISLIATTGFYIVDNIFVNKEGLPISEKVEALTKEEMDARIKEYLAIDPYTKVDTTSNKEQIPDTKTVSSEVASNKTKIKNKYMAAKKVLFDLADRLLKNPDLNKDLAFEKEVMDATNNFNATFTDYQKVASVDELKKEAADLLKIQNTMKNNLYEKPWYEKYWWILVIVGIVMIAGVGGFILYRRNKRVADIQS